MPSVACAMMIGLLCATAQDGQAHHVATIFTTDSWVTPDYAVTFLQSDFHSPYNLDDYTPLCRQKDCRRFKVTGMSRCAIGFQVFEAASSPRGIDNHSYTIEAHALAGLKRALAETYLGRRKAGDYASLGEIVGADLDAAHCPSTSGTPPG
jgi:hypothetical protein